MNTRIEQAPEPVHVVALSGCHTLADKVRYACEHNRPAPTAVAVLDWLVQYGVTAPLSEVSEVVNQWRAAHFLPATEVRTPPGRSSRAAETGRTEPVGVKGFYLVAFLSMMVSIDTSWRFFGQVLHIGDIAERLVMFAVLEVALIACGYGMRANVQRSGRPGAPRLVAWVLCGLAGYMAWQLSGVAAGIARVALGPVLGLVMLHLALGIEIRAGQHKATTWVRIGRELRERVLSRLGLSDDERDALARTRDRAARRAARLSLGRVVPLRAVRLARALRASNVAHDPAARTRMLAELAALRHAAELATLDQPSPWQTTTPGTGVFTGPSGTTVPDRSENGSVNTGGSVRNGGSGPVRERPVRDGTNGHTTTPALPVRRRLADYVTQAREHHEPGMVVTPAWVRSVVPGCPRSTSKNVADTLNRQLANGAAGVPA
jgi:hypothetical protein